MTLWGGIYFELPLTKPLLWFPIAIIPFAVYAYLRFIQKTKVYALELLFPAAILIAGGIQLSGYDWLHVIYFIFLIPLTAFYPLRVILPLTISVPLLEIRHFIDKGRLLEEAAINLTIISAVTISALIAAYMKKKRAALESQIALLQKDITEAKASDTGSIKDDTGVSQYLSNMAKADEEIKEFLLTIKTTLVADSVNLFMPQGESMKLRCSTEDAQNIIPAGEGFVSTCFKEKRTIISSSVSEKGYEIGYLKKGKIASFIGIPVVDEPIVLGVLTADSARFSAFNSADVNTLQLFSKQMIRILQRERAYFQIHRAHTGLRILHEESTRLASSLNLDVLSEKLIEGCHRIAPCSILLLFKKRDVFEVKQRVGHFQLEKTTFNIKGTLLDMVKKNMEPVYLSDVRNFDIPPLPFKTKDVGSLLLLPLVFEKELIGMIAFFADKVNAFSPHQMELLEVLSTQASISIANARFHSEIEKMAITDGLTGLFNHRHFQERLSSEVKRFKRSLEPISLLLIDIDYFKKINDTYGHPVGDKILQGVAKILRKTVRNIDFPARYGGEEFAAILLGTESKGAKNMSERLRKSVMDNIFDADGKELQVTVSIGISTISSINDTKEHLIERADQALYHAKKNGRNQSVLWTKTISL